MNVQKERPLIKFQRYPSYLNSNASHSMKETPCLNKMNNIGWNGTHLVGTYLNLRTSPKPIVSGNDSVVCLSFSPQRLVPNYSVYAFLLVPRPSGSSFRGRWIKQGLEMALPCMQGKYGNFLILRQEPREPRTQGYARPASKNTASTCKRALCSCSLGWFRLDLAFQPI